MHLCQIGSAAAVVVVVAVARRRRRVCVLCVVAFWWGRLSSLLLMVYSISIHPGMTTEAGKRPPGHHIYIVAVAAVNNLLTRPAFLAGPSIFKRLLPCGTFHATPYILAKLERRILCSLSLTLSPEKKVTRIFPPPAGL